MILRLAGVYDEDCRAAFIAQQIARIFERLPTAYLFTGDLNSGQPYLHRDDLVDAVVRTVDRRAELPDETMLLIGEEETPSYEEMQQRIGELIHGERWRTLALPKGFAKLGSWMQDEVLDEDTYIQSWMVENSDDHYEIDISRARRLLGWRPRHSLTGTLPEMIRRLKADPTDWYAKNKLRPGGGGGLRAGARAGQATAAGPLERSEEEVEAAIEQHRDWTLWAPIDERRARPLADRLADDPRTVRSRAAPRPAGARTRDRRGRNPQLRLGRERDRVRPADPRVRAARHVSPLALGAVGHRSGRRVGDARAARLLDHAAPPPTASTR